MIQDLGDIPDGYILMDNWFRVSNAPNQKRGILALSHRKTIDLYMKSRNRRALRSDMAQ